MEKEADAVLAEGVSLGDRRNMVYMGTVIATGKASAIVVATAMDTELGHIAGMLQRSDPSRRRCRSGLQSSERFWCSSAWASSW